MCRLQVLFQKLSCWEFRGRIKKKKKKHRQVSYLGEYLLMSSSSGCAEFTRAGWRLFDSTAVTEMRRVRTCFFFPHFITLLQTRSKGGPLLAGEDDPIILRRKRDKCQCVIISTLGGEEEAAHTEEGLALRSSGQQPHRWSSIHTLTFCWNQRMASSLRMRCLKPMRPVFRFLSAMLKPGLPRT